jgi:methionine-S-sulfoxide reductase
MGTTQHAEVIQVTFDESVISYEDLVHIHLLTHDPTTLNRQGADKGPQYRSVIFYQNEEQKAMVERIIEEIQAEYKDSIVTELSSYEAFYPAEEYHQDFYKRNEGYPYCKVVISPKLQKLRAKYADRLKGNSEVLKAKKAE